MFLLDTNTVSALRRPDRHPLVAEWVVAQPSSEVFISVVTIGEIQRGITREERRDPPFARDLAIWLHQTIVSYGERILPFDIQSAQRWGRLSASLGHQDPDLIIAATALEHDLTVVTRNVRHFQPTGVRILNPFTYQSEG